MNNVHSLEIFDDYKVVVTSMVLRELEKHKVSSNRELAYRTRKAVRYIKNNKDKFIFDTKNYNGSDLGKDYTSEYQDDNILQCCVVNKYGLITGDLLLQMKAEGLNIEVVDLDDSKETVENYSGVKDIYLTGSEDDQQILASVYETPELNQFGLTMREYLYIWNKDKPTYDNDGEFSGYEYIDSFKFDGYRMVKQKFKPVNGRFLGSIKPINKKQEMLFDMLQDDDITVKACFGKFGVGKDFVMIAHALDMIEQGKMDKLIWARNNVELADVPDLGILPGDEIEKLIGFAAPLADHLGGKEGLLMLIQQGKIEIQHIGSLRGRDLKRSILYCTEFQNNTRGHAKLFLGRIGEGSQLWVNGDLEQTDSDVYRNNSGIRAMYNLKGNFLYGQATLDKIERSETARLSELI